MSRASRPQGVWARVQTVGTDPEAPWPRTSLWPVTWVTRACAISPKTACQLLSPCSLLSLVATVPVAQLLLFGDLLFCSLFFQIAVFFVLPCIHAPSPPPFQSLSCTYFTSRLSTLFPVSSEIRYITLLIHPRCLWSWFPR